MRYALQRLLQFVVVFMVVTFLVMVAIRLGSADPARDLAGGASATEAQVEALRQQYHLDASFPVQYFFWIKNLVTFDLGFSPVLGVEVAEALKQRAPVTLMLGVYAVGIGILIALPVAVISAYRRDGWFDRVGGWLSFGFVSLPNLVLAVLLSYFLAVKIDYFPRTASKVWPWDDPYEHFKNFFLPAISLGLGLAAVFTRLLRADMVNTLQSDFITLARAKGLPPRRILWRHALRSSVFSIVTSVALQLGAVLGGAVAIETVFALPGMGDLLVGAVQRNDLLVIQACAAVFAGSVVLVNFGVDLLYSVIDPRIRHARALG